MIRDRVIVFFLLCLALTQVCLADFVVRDNQTINRGDRDGYKNASFYCFRDGTCFSTATGATPYNDTNVTNRLGILEQNASQSVTRDAQINTSSNVGVLGKIYGFNTTVELLSYFAGIFLDKDDQRYNESQRISDLNSSLTQNASDQAAAISSKINSSQDQNNYTIECSVTGTSSKTVTCSRNGASNVSFSFSDIDTDTNSGGISNVTTIITGSNYVIVSGNATHFNVTLNYTAANTAWNDTTLIQTVNSSLNLLISSKVGNGTHINASRLQVNSVDVCLSNGTNCLAAAADQNNYTVSIDVTGTTTKTINLVRNGASNINATFTDIDTDTFNTTAQMIAATNNTLNALRVACGNITGAAANLCTITQVTDTNSGGVSNVTTLITGSNFLIVSFNATHFNVTLNLTAVNASFNDTALIQALINGLNTSLMANDSAQAIQIAAINGNLTIILGNISALAGNQSMLNQSIGTINGRLNAGNISIGNASVTRTQMLAGTFRIVGGRNASVDCVNDTSNNVNCTINAIDTTGGGGGNVSSNTVSQDNGIPRFHSTTGLLIQNSSASLNDDGLLIVPSVDTTAITIDGKQPCLEDGTNCPDPGNPFDQDLNTGDNVAFNDVGVARDLLVGTDGSGTLIVPNEAGDPAYRLFITSDGSTYLLQSGIDIMNSGSSDALLRYNTSGLRWSTGVQSSGAVYRIIDSDGSTLLEANKNSDSVTAKNLIGESSYNGNPALTAQAASGMTVDILQVKNSTGNIWVSVNSAGVVNASRGLRTNLSNCDVLNVSADGLLQCDTDATGSGGGIGNDSDATLNRLNVTADLTVNGRILEYGRHPLDSRVEYFCDFLDDSASFCGGLLGASINSGTQGDTFGRVGEPGCINVSDTASANSGFAYRTGLNAILLSGNETFDFRFSVSPITNRNASRMYFGFFDTANNAAIVDGAWAEVVNQTMFGVRTSNATAGNGSTTNLTLAPEVDYWGSGKINSGKTALTVILYNASGLVYNQTVSNLLPNGAVGYTGGGALAITTTAGTVSSIGNFCYIGLSLPSQSREYALQ